MKRIIIMLLTTLCLISLVGCKSSDTSNKADLVIYGNFYTSNDDNAHVSAVGIKDGTFIYVGDEDGVKEYIGDNTKVETYDQDKLITAGLVDGHTHITALMIGQMDSLGHISQGANKDTCIKEIADYVNDNPNLEFYTLTGWEMQNFSDEDYGCPNANMLDGITDKPILALSSDGHSYWVNNALIKLAGVTKDSVSADGGVIVKDGDGNPIGVFKDTAQYLIDNARPSKKDDVCYAGIAGADEFCISQGYVYRFNALDNQQYNALETQTIDCLEDMDKKGELKTYIQGSFVINNTDDAIDLIDDAIRIKEETKGGNYEMTTVKIFLDGIVENAGAYLIDPYLVGKDIKEENYYGTQRWKGEDAIVKMGHIIAKANKAGMSCHFHGMGDHAISDILDAIELAAEEVGIETVKEARNAVAHLALVQDSDFDRFAKYNVVAVFNPWCNKDPGYYDLQVEYLGKQRADSQYPMQSFLKAGVPYAFGTDLGASFTYNCVECFHALTTRTYNNDDPNSLLCADEKLSREETIKAMTIGCAYQLKKEDVFGSIEVGKDASLTIFSKDLLTIPDDEIMSTELVNTMYKGEWLKAE